MNGDAAKDSREPGSQREEEGGADAMGRRVLEERAG